MLIALGERSQENFNVDISSFLDGLLLILSKFWWVSWKKSCSFWDKISQTLSNIFYALEKFSKLWSNFLMLCGKALKLSSNFITLWQKALKLSSNFIMLSWKALELSSNFFDGLGKHSQTFMEFLWCFGKRPQFFYQFSWRIGKGSQTYTKNVLDGFKKVSSKSQGWNFFLYACNCKLCQKSFHVKWRKFPSKDFGCLWFHLLKGGNQGKWKEPRLNK